VTLLGLGKEAPLDRLPDEVGDLCAWCPLGGERREMIPHLDGHPDLDCFIHLHGFNVYQYDPRKTFF
jgi:hypothetical protein